MRIFPDKQSPLDDVDRNVVRLCAKLNVAIPNIPLYFTVFDVDDPTPSSFDPSGIIDSNGRSGNDNRGEPSTGSLNATSGTTDENGEVNIEFTVTQQPGDNFRAAVAFDQAELGKLTATTPSSSYYVTPDNASIPGFCGTLGPMLTVWRRLWFEFDSMGTWPSSGDEKNFETGTITGIQTNTPVAEETTLHLSLRLLDESDRYENGYIQITGFGPYPVVSNSDNLLDNDTVVISGIAPTNVVGNTFVIYDDDDVTLGARSPRRMPYALSGGTLFDTAFADAYIKPEHVPYTTFDADIPFIRNLGADLYDGTYLSKWLPTVTFGCDYEQSENFWYVYVVAAFQPETSFDCDPDILDNTGVFGQAEYLSSVNRAVIYVETIRELEILPSMPRIFEAHNLIHEIGHLGGGAHTDMGIMEDGAPINENQFAPITIKRFRSNTTY